MRISSLDHIVLVVRDISATCTFYERILGLEPVQDAAGQWSLRFGANKISLQQEGAVPEIARQTLRGTGNFCLLTETPIGKVVERLEQNAVPVLEGPARKGGATGPILSVYFYDPDGNLVEVARPL